VLLFSGIPCSAGTAGSGPDRDRIAGNALGACREMCSTTTTGAGRSAGRPPTSARNASTPPAEAPTTTMSVIVIG
jgi:hypothetical protein